MASQFVSPHVHPQSLDTGSAPEAFVKRAVELGAPAIACTDHGSVSCCRNMGKLAKKQGIYAISGAEVYFRDDDCSTLAGSGIEKVDGKYDKYLKYGHLSLHAKDHAAYKALVRGLSDGDLRGEQHGSERKPILNWANLEDIGSHNVTATSSCLVGVVSRHLLAGRPDIAIKYYERIRGTFKPGHFYVELFPHVCDTNWVKAVFVKTADKELRFWFGKKLRVVDAKGNTHEYDAEELAKKWKAGMVLVAIKNYSKWDEQPPAPILDVRAVEGFQQNECQPWCPDGDVQRAANIFMMQMARRYGDPVLVSDDAHLAVPEDKPVQDIRLMTMGDWRFASSYHMRSNAEAFAYFRDYLYIDEATFDGWVENSHTWAAQFKDFKFQDEISLPTKFYPQETLKEVFRLFEKHGRFNQSPEQVERIQYELQMLHWNGKIDLLPYMFMGEDFCSHYEFLGKLSGPGRGSAGGLLTAYLLGITHVDPLKYGLSADRFLTSDRVLSGKMPDIDMDFADREPLIDPENGYLKKRFGDHYAQVSTDTLMRLRSSIKDVHRVLDGRVSPEIETLTKKLPIPPQGIPDSDFVFGYTDSDDNEVKGIIETDDNLRQYAVKYPNHWAIVEKALTGIVRSKNRHASAYAVMNCPVQEVIPTVTIGGVRCTADTAAWVEAAGAIKIDLLGVNSLKDIEVAIKLIQGKQKIDDIVLDGKLVPGFRVVPDPRYWKKWYDVWDLPEDQAIFAEICRANVDKSVFQFGGDAAKGYLEFFLKDDKHLLRSVSDLATFTALARPGPCDAYVEKGEIRRNMLQEFSARALGEEPIGNIPALDKMFPETYGVIAFQEQLTKVFRVIGKTSGIQAENFRIHTSKKQAAEVIKDKALFMPGATETVGATEAQRLWNMMETHASYSFNKSHAVAYSHIGYACAWLRHHYPLEWWTAVLRNADRNEIDKKFWKHCGHLVDLPDVALSGDEFEIQGERIRAPLSMLNGVGPGAAIDLSAIKPYANVQEFCQKVADLKVSRSSITPEGKTRKGRSALNRGVMTKLILSGAADSLFAPDTGVYDKLVAYSEAYAVANKKRKPEPIDPRLMNLTPLQRYLLKKEVLPAHHEELVPTVALTHHAIKNVDGQYLFLAKKQLEGDDRLVPVVHGTKLAAIAESKEDGVVRVAVVAYVSAVEWFWQNKAARIRFDVNGERVEAVKWPERDGRAGRESSATPPAVPANLMNSVAILCLTRFRADKGLTLDDIVVVQEALDLKEEESA